VEIAKGEFCSDFTDRKSRIRSEPPQTALEYALRNGHDTIVEYLQHESRRKHVGPALERDLKIVHMLHNEIMTALSCEWREDYYSKDEEDPENDLGWAQV